VCQGAAYPLTPVALRDRHPHDTPRSFIFRLERRRANDLAMHFRHDKSMTPFRVMRCDVVQVWIACLVYPAEVLTQTGED